ncbi:hypothetical protein ACHAWO_008038 [Cyclotella atomus]|uniref:Uncharacterized protein n=1 Tax=Cyclotella atomus TaxID=382360 RepID=A0ABD3P7N9_9STRA
MKLSTITSLLLIGSAASTHCPTVLTKTKKLTKTLTLFYEEVEDALCARMESKGARQQLTCTLPQESLAFFMDTPCKTEACTQQVSVVLASCLKESRESTH